MADQIHDKSEVNATRMAFIAEIIQRELEAAAKVRPLITDVSEFAVKGRKSISFPKLGSFSVQKISEGQKADAQALTASVDTLDLDQHASVQWILKNQATIQSTLQWEAASIQRAGSAHGREFDKDILEALVSGAAAANDVTYASGSYEDNILEAAQKLDEANAPEEGRFMLIRPAQKRVALGIANFVQADRYGDRTPLLTGELGQAYGFRFVVSNISTTSFVDGVSLALHREACAYGFQLGENLESQQAIEYGTGSKRYALDSLYGYKVLQSGNLISKIA